MKFVQMLLTASALFAVPAAAQATSKDAGTVLPAAAAPLAVTPNAMIFSADGRRIGRVDHVRLVNGAPASASVIFAGHFVDVPVSTLSAKDGGFVSTLNVAQIVKR